MKKQNQAAATGKRVSELSGIHLVVLFFCIASVFSWWFFITLLSNSHSLLQYGLFGSDDTLVTIGAAAMIDTEDNMMVNNTRRIDGIIVNSPDKANFWPYAVMIENLRSVRPQSGLSQAAVVYEALVEGGATRFLAVFDPSEIIPEIMPVRSARPYYIEWASEYNALYVHAGGSPKALTVIWENPDFKDLEALSRDSKYFWRDTTKYAPHNLVTSSEKMNFALHDKELIDTKAKYQSWKFKDDATQEERGADGKKLEFNFSYGTTYLVGYTYNQEQNYYLRENANEPHLDKNTGKQIAVKNVIVQLVEGPVLNGGAGRLDIFVGGEGKAWVLRDGEIIEGIWKKGSRTDRTLFYDMDGNELELNRGNTWIHIITKTQDVTYN